MFYGENPDRKGWSTHAQLAEMIRLLVPAPVDLINRGKRSPELFAKDGKA